MTDEVIESPAPAAPAPAPAQAAPSPATSPTPSPAPEPPPSSKWSATWREDMAGSLPETATDDEKAEHTKLLKRLQRFSSPADAAKALREQDKLISSGQLKRALPKDAKPEQVAEWRKENGIPETPDKYDFGVTAELNELDKDLLGKFAAKAHAANASPDTVKAMAAAYVEMRDSMAQRMETQNAQAKNEAIEVLRSEWGPDYKNNVDGVDSLLKSSPSTVAEAITAARTEDGVQLLNNPEVMRWLAGHARELGYVGATVVPAGGDLGKTIDDELDTLRKQMGTDEWAKNAKGQARFIQLMEAKQRRESKK